MPTLGSVGDALDNTMMEPFWSSMQNELRDRKHWRTRLKLTNAISEYIEIFVDRQRRHSSIDSVSPIEFDSSLSQQTA